MGCDIHLRLERRMKSPKSLIHEDITGKVVRLDIEHDEYAKIRYERLQKWHSCEMTDNKCWSERCYGMFARLANVRNNFIDKIEPMEVRGFPKDANESTLRAYCYELIPDELYEKNVEMYDRWSECGDNGYCSETFGSECVRDNLSTIMGENNGHMLISGPDWHSANWCTTQEMRKMVTDNFYTNELGWHGDYVEWLALVGAMEAIETDGNYECRAVFWFDN